MAQLQLQSFSTLVSNAAAAVQASCSQLLDMTAGSVLRAILEASASCGLWMQWLILQVLAMTRAATSAGADLDSWMADYAFARLPAVASIGAVTFSRYAYSRNTLIPVGSQVKTADGSVTFSVLADPGNPYWNAGLGGILIPSGVQSGTCNVQCVTAGAAGNVQAGTVTLIASALSGVDTCSNAAPFANGIDAEADAAFRVRFQGYVAALSRSTAAAVGYAVSAVQQGLSYTITESVNPDGSANPGSFFVVVDDGTGAPPGSLITAVANSIGAYRALGINAYVFGPSVLTATIALTVVVAPGYDGPTVRAAVKAAILAVVNGLTIGADLPFYQVPSVAFGASLGVQNITGVTINGGTSDLIATPLQVIRATSASVSVS